MGIRLPSLKQQAASAPNSRRRSWHSLRLWGLLTFVILLGVVAAPFAINATHAQSAPPRQPTKVFGTVTFGVAPAPAGTVVVATIGGVNVRSTSTNALGFYQFNVPADDLATTAKDGGEAGEIVVLYVGAADGYTGDANSFQVTFGIGSTPPAKNMTVPTNRVLTLASSYSPFSPKVGTMVSLSGNVATKAGTSVSSATGNVTWGDTGTSVGTSNSSGVLSLTHTYSSTGTRSIGVVASKSGYVPASESHSVL